MSNVLSRYAPVLLESPHVTAIRGLLYAFALTLYLRPVSSMAGIVTAICAGLVAMPVAIVAHRHHLRVAAALVVAPLTVLGAAVVSDYLLDRGPLAAIFGVKAALALADVVTFGLIGFVSVFLLRLLAIRVRVLSLLEVAFVAGSVAAALSDHRNRMINRPRFLSDWAWSQGIDPATVFVAVGGAATLVAALLFLRSQRVLKLVTTVVLLVFLGAGFFLVSDKRIRSPDAADPLGLSGKRHGKSPREGDGTGDNPFKNDYRPPSAPQPAAVAVLRDDFEPRDGVVYFRQRTLSRYNGVHLTADARQDADVLVDYPSEEVVEAPHVQAGAAHVEVPTTMYLVVDHPQPVALTHAQRLRMVDNPNPRRFVAAYEVESKVLAVPSGRLLGYHSMPASWSAERRRHYTTLPDDPRYGALAEQIVREVDPRFAHDDLAKAFAVKRYLEREGFYTRRSKHASERDPTASFLFGSLRGYCVHFAHAAVYLFRSEGIASRVALGYAVQTTKRGGGSAMLIMSDRAHAWPEIHLAGIGWVTFDIYPERTDMPPASAVDYDLEKMLGELARRDPTAGVGPQVARTVIPWRVLGRSGALLMLLLLAAGFGVKLFRRAAPLFAGEHAYWRVAYIATLDRLGDVGHGRRRGETRERHAARVSQSVPHLARLTEAHMAVAYGSQRTISRQAYRTLVVAVSDELKDNTRGLRRFMGLINPISWIWTR
jgi:hypothetical protein